MQPEVRTCALLLQGAESASRVFRSDPRPPGPSLYSLPTMNIRAKVVLLVFPLIVGPLLVTGYIAALSARNGITGIATSFLRFKIDDLENYANSQWALLVQNNMVGSQEFVDAAKDAVSSFARSLVRDESELIFAVDAQGNMVLSTGDIA